jgi:hypothetical protein
MICMYVVAAVCNKNFCEQKCLLEIALFNMLKTWRCLWTFFC